MKITLKITLIKISLNIILCGPIDNTSSLVQKMTGHQADDKPLPEPMKPKVSPGHNDLTLTVHAEVISPDVINISHFE